MLTREELRELYLPTDLDPSAYLSLEISNMRKARCNVCRHPLERGEGTRWAMVKPPFMPDFYLCDECDGELASRKECTCSVMGEASCPACQQFAEKLYPLHEQF